jgi:hypothetical protein
LLFPWSLWLASWSFASLHVRLMFILSAQSGCVQTSMELVTVALTSFLNNYKKLFCHSDITHKRCYG